MKNGCSFSIFHFPLKMENGNNGMYTTTQTFLVQETWIVCQWPYTSIDAECQLTWLLPVVCLESVGVLCYLC